MAVAQIGLGEGAADAGGERGRIAPAGPHPRPLLAHHDGGAGILAHRQHLAGGDIGVLEEVEGDEAVIIRRLGVVEDVAQLLEMAGAQEMLAIDEALLRQEGERLGVDLDDALAREIGRGDIIAGQLAIGRRIRPVREDVVEVRLGHLGVPWCADERSFPV